MNKPDFFVIGVPKCGTTSLYEYLRQHPQIFMSSVKEPHFFGRDLPIAPHTCVRDESKYRELFADTGDAKRIGEASVWYLYSKQASREIREFNPSARIIIMLRNPIDMLYSLHGQLLRSGQEEILDFEEALAAEADRRDGRRIPDTVRFPQSLFYREIVRFTEQVERYLEQFGREGVPVIVFDDFAQAPAGVYRRVLTFLDVNADFTPEFRTFNRATPIRHYPFQRALMARPKLRWLAQHTSPLAWRRWVGETIRSMRSALPRSLSMSSQTRQRLGESLAPEIQQLGQLLGRDLSHWCGERRRPKG